MISFLVAEPGLSVGLGCMLALLIGLAIKWQIGNELAEAKGRALLRYWLTPEQARQWDLYGHFEVIGSDTGTHYRVRYGRAVNIDELDADGKTIAHWCFAPEGDLVVGDVMLGQKVALELMEREALGAANRFATV
jgi:hypothetical protein